VFIPNPTNEKLVVKFDKNSNEMVKINLYSVLGQRLYEKEIFSAIGLNVLEIQTYQIPNGIYNVVLSSKTGSINSKVIVQH
jgi:hypothetical protein